jgi:hypothetical protein
MKLIEVNNENIDKYGIYCIKDKKAPGYEAKKNWYLSNFKTGLKLIIALNEDNVQMGFIEFAPAEKSWRPVDAKYYTFIHCIFVYPNKFRNNQVAESLINFAIEGAKAENCDGICTFTSKGAWISNDKIFKKLEFEKVDKLGRFELMSKKFSDNAEDPKFINWKEYQKDYSGWNIIYSDQCPWHQKAIIELSKVAEKEGFEITIKRIESASEAKNAPTGFGTFALIKDGKELADHYISKTRFNNIIKKELNL